MNFGIIWYPTRFYSVLLKGGGGGMIVFTVDKLDPISIPEIRFILLYRM